MKLFEKDNAAIAALTSQAEKIAEELAVYPEHGAKALDKFIADFKMKTADFYRENRKLNIGIVGQVKAGKSSFLNTLLFEGREVLPKAATPKTATLTKMEYAEQNSIRIEYYTPDEWDEIEDNSMCDLDDDIYTSARELVGMARRNGVNPREYVERGSDVIEFDTYDRLIAELNDYVGEDGRYTPFVKAVVLSLNNEEFRGISIVDTPGLNDPIESRTLRTKEFIEVCDVVFFLSQSGSFLDKSDWELLSSQLPQKGVKRLALIASKYDSGVRDVLRARTEEDDIFGMDDNSADNIPDACKIVRKKLKKQAKNKVKEYERDLEERGKTELIGVINQCAEPIMASSIVYNMTRKPRSEYNAEENNIYNALSLFSSDIDADLKKLGNFDEITELFGSVVAEKEEILRKKAESFVPTAAEELKTLLSGMAEKAAKRAKILRESDMGTLTEQRSAIQSSIDLVKADITEVFGELGAKLESEKLKGTEAIRAASKDYLNVRERTGTETKTGSYTTGHWFWKKYHTYTYNEHYSYCLASDALENLNKFALEATSRVERVFSDAVALQGLKRKLLNVAARDFDTGSENYDASLIRIAVEESVNEIELPVFKIDISDTMNSISGKFCGELRDAKERTALVETLQSAVGKVYNELSDKLIQSVKELKASLDEIKNTIGDRMLEKIMEEYDLLAAQCADKDAEIAAYEKYAAAADACCKGIRA